MIWQHSLRALGDIGERIQRRYRAARVPRSAGQPWYPGEPIVVAGMFNTASGIGECARLAHQALTEKGLNPIAVDISHLFGPVDMQCAIPFGSIPKSEHGLLILSVNSPETVQTLHFLQRWRFPKWRVVGVWAWELERLPDYWMQGFEYVDEIWAPSSFTARAIDTAGRIKAKVVPLPVKIPKGISAERLQFGLGAETFVVLAASDLLSSPLRKNPFGAIDAFRRAFGNAQDVRLIIKLRNIDRDVEFEKQLLSRIEGAQNIQILDRVLHRKDMLRLISSADTYLSLHRSEGLGLPLAEAMLLGVPTVATAWSGNLDFMSNETAMLVPYVLTPISAPDPYYGSVPDAEWAEPNIEEAANALKVLKSDPAVRKRISHAARVFAERHFSYDHYLEATGLKHRSKLLCDSIDAL